MLALLFALAHAETHPLVLRFDAAGQTYGSLSLKLTVGETKAEVALADDGARPDFAAGDGRYAGVSNTDAAAASLELFTDATSLGTTTITFTDPTQPHDVDLLLQAGALVATVSAPPSPDAQAGARSGGGGGVSSGASAVTGAPAPVSFSAPSSSGSGDDGTLFIALGVGLLALVGAGWFWQRSKNGSARSNSELQVLPEPAFLAPGLPSLSDGLTAWVAAGEASAILQPLLESLATHHRVLLVARTDLTVSPLVGGPVYRVNGVRPGLVGDVAEALHGEGGAPLAVLLVLGATEREALRDYRDLLPKQTGGIVLLSEGVESPLPRVDVAAESEGWKLTFGATTARVRRAAHGLTVAGGG